MKLTSAVLLTYFSVSLAQNKSGYRTVDDRWSWGVVEDPVTKKDEKQNLQDKSSTSTTTESSYGPCADYNPPKPSFKAPGRRINEEKCEEYIYDIKQIEELNRRTKECVEIRHGTTALPPFEVVGGRPALLREFPHMVNGKTSCMIPGFAIRDSDPNEFPLGAVGGRPALPGEFPHMGAIGWLGVRGDYIFKCGSTLISPKFMMTAAHCIRAPPDTSIEDTEPKIIRLNDQNLFFTPNGSFHSEDINISRIIVHPQYKSPKKYYDIALMELASEVHFTYKLKPACLWNRPDTGDFGKEVSLTGWGVLAHGSLDISPNLQAANVDIIDSKLCDELLEGSRNRHWAGLAEHQLCAGKLEGGVDACQGDSGGPLQFRKPLLSSQEGNLYYVIGITSFGVGCAWANHPGIYTRVSSFIDWIEENVWK